MSPRVVFESDRDEYADSIDQLHGLTGDDLLWIAGFGRADFIGGFSQWCYETYLECLAVYPEQMCRYYDYTAHQAHMFNTAVAAAIPEVQPGALLVQRRRSLLYRRPGLFS